MTKKKNKQTPAVKRPMEKPFPNLHNNRGIDSPGRRRFLFANLLIAISGGIPGVLSILAYLRHPTVRIRFDESHTIICRITNSPDPDINGCTALLLWGVTVVGAEEEKFVAFEVDLSIRADGTWYDGQRFKPVQHETSNSDGTSSKELKLFVGVPNFVVSQKATTNPVKGIAMGDTVLVSDWKEFAPGVSVGFGEPQTFMIANYFPTAPQKHTIVDRIRIKIIDYLGNSYSEEFGTGKFRYAKIDFFLDQGSA